MFRRTGRGRLLLLTFLALSISLITIDYRRDLGIVDKAREVSSSVVGPVQRGLTTVFRPVGDFFSSIGELSRLRAENDELESRVEELESQISRARQIEEENERMSELLDLRQPWISMPTVAAEVSGNVPSNYKWAVYIDKGSSDGIEPDMAVVNHEGLVGKVLRTDPHQSVVLLMIDPGAGAGARVQGINELGTLWGNGGDRPLTLDLINKTSDVSIGDEVVTAAQGGSIFPSAIPIGRIAAVTSESAGLDHAIEVEPYVQFTKLDYVKVLLRIGPPPQKVASAKRDDGDGR